MARSAAIREFEEISEEEWQQYIALKTKLSPQDWRRLLDCEEIEVSFVSCGEQAVIVGQEPFWREENGVIRFSVTSDGTTGPEWISRLEEQRFVLLGCTRDLLNSADFMPTNGVVYSVAVLKDELLGDDPTSENAMQVASTRSLLPLHAEAACLVRELVSDAALKRMDLLQIRIMHEPIPTPNGPPNFLAVSRLGGAILKVCSDCPDNVCLTQPIGFAFRDLQVETNS